MQATKTIMQVTACFHFEEWWQALSFMSFLSVFDLGKEPLTES